MAGKNSTSFNRVEPIEPAWRSTVFGDCAVFNSRQYLLEQRQFGAMKHAFRLHGGFVNVDELALKLRCCCEYPISHIARWIVSRSVVCISWEAQSLMPAFQFTHDNMLVRPCCANVIDELRDVLNNWELSLWFAAPNIHLDYASPVAILANEESAVFQAARRDRLLAQY